MRVIVDAMGGDNAPIEIVKGALEAIERSKDLNVVLSGRRAEIQPVLNGVSERIEILDAEDIIAFDESPAAAVRNKPNSSLVIALEALKARDDVCGLVSAGSTGAVLTGAFMKVGRIKGISRPALAGVLPTVTGGNVLLCDCGANVDCKPVNLLHFAVMGEAYARALGVENPKVGLISNGTEEGKGNALTKEAYALIADSGLNFVGNVESRELLSGNIDVAVVDGFDGNLVLKTCEGTAISIFSWLKQSINVGGFRAKLGAMFLKPALKSVKHTLDYNENGGACFIGVEKIVMKAHGSAKSASICASILQVAALAEADIIGNIKKRVDVLKAEIGD